MATNNAVNAATTNATLIAGTGSAYTNIAYSSTGGTSNIVSRDSNGNTHSNNFESATTGNAASGTITLTAASTRVQVFSSGSGSATVVLPDATTLQNGHVFELNNNASGTISVQANGGGALFSMTPGSYAEVILLSNSFPSGQWDYHWQMPSNAAYGTAGLAVTGTVSASSLTTNEMVYGGSSGLLTSLSNGSSGQVLTSNGSSAPSFQAISSSGAITQINGDSGNATPSSGIVAIITNNASLMAGSTVKFTGSFGTLTLNVTDGNNNTLIGSGAGNLSLTGDSNTAVGQNSMNILTSGEFNCGFGLNTLVQTTSGSRNTAIGYDTFNKLATGGYNTGIGFEVGDNYTGSESSNILINNAGIVSESNVLRIGAGTGTGNQQLSTTYISGINGNTTAKSNMVSIDSSSNQLCVVSAGAQGTYLTSDGTNWLTSSNPLIYVTKNITSAQIKALHGIPIQVVGTPGSGKVLQLIGTPYFKFNYGGTNAFTAAASQTVNLAYGTATTIANSFITNAQLIGTTTGYDYPSATSATLVTPANIENLALNLYNPISTEISGNAANDNSITISFYYTIVTMT